jgi:hypothetical protein
MDFIRKKEYVAGATTLADHQKRWIEKIDTTCKSQALVHSKEYGSLRGFRCQVDLEDLSPSDPSAVAWLRRIYPGAYAECYRDQCTWFFY